MYKVDLNSDLGESFGAYTIGLDNEVIAHAVSYTHLDYEVYPGTPFDGFQGFWSLSARYIAGGTSYPLTNITTTSPQVSTPPVCCRYGSNENVLDLGSTLEMSGQKQWRG